MPQLGHDFVMKGSIVEGGGGGGVGPDLLFQGTLGQELLYRTPYAQALFFGQNQGKKIHKIMVFHQCGWVGG